MEYPYFIDHTELILLLRNGNYSPTFGVLYWLGMTAKVLVEDGCLKLWQPDFFTRFSGWCILRGMSGGLYMTVLISSATVVMLIL